MSLHGKRTRWWSLFSFGLLALGLTGVVSAGTTGKIAGKVLDANGAPLPGVAITIEGTRLGASSDADGQYIILQVQPGERTVTAQLIGYQTVSIKRVVVNADLTTQVNFRLQEEVLQVGSLVVTAERPEIEADVTSSQIIVSSDQVSDAPVPSVLDYMAYEPGVSLAKGNELRIRGGNADEIRFKVDDLDRTDALTNKGLTHLNLTLVSEVTVLTGGFNAEYGNMRSGVVNAVYKDGSERGWGPPWVSTVLSMAPTQRKHFGPGAYDSDQYDYLLKADPAITGATMPERDDDGNIVLDGNGDPVLVPLDNLSTVYWPDLYDVTRNNEEFQELFQSNKNQYVAFRGWDARAQQALFFGAFNRRNWTGKQMREAWQWEANMNEQVWEYANEPDRNIDLSLGQALPNRWGGIVLGYSFAKAMTAVPAIRPYYTDEAFDAKLTLTPVDKLKVRLSMMVGNNRSTGAGDRANAVTADELADQGGGVVYGNDPVGLRAPSQLISSVMATAENAPNNKLNLSYNSRLNGDYSQYGGTVTYTFSPTTFLEMSMSHLTTDWDQPRDPPRADVTDFSGGYSPNNSYAWGGRNGLLHQVTGLPVFIWKPMPEYELVDGEYVLTGNTVIYPTHPDQVAPENMVPRSPYDWDDPYPIDEIQKVQQEAADVFTTKDFVFENTDGTFDTVTVVSPQGWVEGEVKDLSGTFNVGGQRKVVFENHAVSDVLKVNLTHNVKDHTFKIGGELIRSSIDFKWQDVNPIMRGYSRSRDYTANPRSAGLYAQDKFESQGMIINVGMRADYFDAGSPVYTPDNIFDTRFWRQGNFGGDILDSLSLVYPDRVWPIAPRQQWPAGVSADELTFPDDPITPAELRSHIVQEPATTYWRYSPRAGISHPVGHDTKLFFNYGHFYQAPQAKFLHGLGFYEGPMGFAQAAVRDVEYANLRPVKTTMYEVGLEKNIVPLGLLATVRGYSKYNTDQIATLVVHPQGGQQYTTYRNSNYENIQGLEIKLARMRGRFFYGWATYNYIATASGQVGYSDVYNDPAVVSTVWPADPVTSNSPDNFQAQIGVRTPADWGALAGGWSANLIQTWVEGAEVIYNPENIARRLLPDEYIMKKVDYWNTDLKIQKTFNLPKGRSISAYLDVANLFNAKRLELGDDDYMLYVIDRRTKGGESDLRYGDESTWRVFTEPYQDSDGNWHAPLAPELEWIQFLNPRSYRFGVRISL